ncbi:HAMP domain-containing histidine kinase [Gelidibacter salicanalis]|uniref:histidine kinase n=1 Tax=Gelidibacter salicanalis TaxID=291193 RepID=A0A5C7AIL5_9FLAO|nr:HAMP domain-containing sensor histidine kinase [Gelidibacter salicanalis]TXE05662.1 HAMP domain-containing histidine kinase [Gelidibacter salicanalis]
MKLLNHTSKYLAIILVPLITIWAFIFYYAMLDEIYDSLDDGLENQKVLLLQRLPTNPEILEHKDLELWSHSITPVSKTYHDKFTERYSDTLMFMLNEKDYEPVRVYETKIAYNDSYYKVKFITSMVEEDDLIQDLITYLIVLYILLMISIVILNNLMLKKIWKPFHSLVSQLPNFRIEKNHQITTKDTSIDEFKLLNASITTMVEQSRARYLEQQHFIENASHELQTPLAISINKLELFLENTTLSEDELKTMASILDNLGRLTRLNKSLLLLSKIENRQFTDEEDIDFNLLISSITQDFEDLASHKHIRLTIDAKEQLNFQMNKDLAIILLTNLIKNAIVHGQQHNTVHIVIARNLIKVQNYGAAEPLNAHYVFSRFKKLSSDKKSTGLGLAIAKAITEKYSIEWNYEFTTQHNFTLSFPDGR